MKRFTIQPPNTVEAIWCVVDKAWHAYANAWAGRHMAPSLFENNRKTAHLIGTRNWEQAS